MPDAPTPNLGLSTVGYSPSDVEAMIRASAARYGINPDTAVKVARSEGLNSYVGDGGSSFGPFQLHYGNVAGGGNAVGGLGDVFTKQTGLNARDPSTVPQQVDFALSQAAKGGWTPWHGAQRVGVGNRDGISGAPGTMASASSTYPAAQPVAASAPQPSEPDPDPLQQVHPAAPASQAAQPQPAANLGLSSLGQSDPGQQAQQAASLLAQFMAQQGGDGTASGLPLGRISSILGRRTA